MPGSAWLSRHASALVGSRKYLCLSLAGLVLAVAAVMGWTLHPLLALGFLLGCGYRILRYYRQGPEHS